MNNQMFFVAYLFCYANWISVLVAAWQEWWWLGIWCLAVALVLTALLFLEGVRRGEKE